MGGTRVRNSRKHDGSWQNGQTGHIPVLLSDFKLTMYCFVSSDLW